MAIKGPRLTSDLIATFRIKDVRKRRAPTPTAGAGAPDAGPFNPFASAAPAPAPAPQSTGFNFGQTQSQSQSFPGATPAAGQGGMFSSGINGQAGGQASFSFGGGPTSFGAPPPSNPFAVDTSFGGNSQTGTNGFSFGGFGAGGGSTQSTPSFGGFGTQQSTSTPASTPAGSGLFGQSTAHITSPADDSMQTSPDTKPKGASIFTAKPATGGSAPANPFASLPGQNSNNIFAPKSTPTEQASKPAETQPFKPLFGAAPAASKPDEAKAQPATSNPFAPKPTSDGTAASNPFANLSGQTTAPTNNLFAPKPAAEQTPAKPVEAAKPFGALFGSSSTLKPSEPPSNPFAPKPAAEGSAASNPFANLSAPKVTGTESSGKPAETQPFKSMFGTPAKTSDAEKEPSASPAFGNIFATPKPAAENVASKPSETQPFKSLFGTPAPSAEAGKESSASPAFGNMFATPKPAAENAAVKPAESQPFKPMLGASVTSKPAEAEKDQSATSNIFAPKKASEDQTPGSAKTQPFGSMFGASPAPAKSGDEKSAPTPSNPFASLSGQNSFSSPFAPKTTEQTTAPVQASSSLFGSSIASKPEQEKPAQAVDNNNVGFNNFTSSFSGPKATSQPEKEGATANTTPRAPSSQVPSQASSKDANSCVPFSPSSSLPPSASSTPTIYPHDVSNTRTAQEADSLFPNRSNPASIEYPDMPLKPLYPGRRDSHPVAGAAYMKLCMLTSAFQHQVAMCNPETDDIDEVILLYVELRRELGIPIGAIDPAEESKRADINAREAAEDSRAAQQSAPVTVANPPTSASPPSWPAKKDDSAKATSGASDTANKFKQSFSSPSAPSAPAASPVNSFTSAAAPVASAAPVSFTPASVPATNVTEASVAAIPKFGSDANGTAPGAAAPAFAIPKFGSGSATTGGTDFMAQFKAKAEKTAAEEKAKRKAEDFDSDEDDEAEWERKDAEEQREKRAKLEAAAAKRSVFVPGEGFKFVDNEVAPATTAAEPALEPSTSAAAPSTASFGANAFPSYAPSTWAGNSSVTNSERHYETNNPSPASASLFGARPGGLNPMFAPSSNPSANTSVFGSSLPVPASQNIFGGLKNTSPKRKSVDESDNEDGSPLKKSKASPPASTAGSVLFGRVSNPATPALTPFATQNSSPEVTASTAPVPPETPPIQNSSPEVTALTAPVPPDTPPAVSEAPSTAATGTEDDEGEPGQIFDLTKGNGGEEDETVVFELRARSFKLDGTWTTQGTGVARLLQHPATGRSRMVLRAEPSGNVILNTLLKKEYKYALTSTSVQFTVPDENGNYAQWAVRVKRENLDQFFAKIEETKY
jgi:hypothetical protein